MRDVWTLPHDPGSVASFARVKAFSGRKVDRIVVIFIIAAVPETLRTLQRLEFCAANRTILRISHLCEGIGLSRSRVFFSPKHTLTAWCIRQPGIIGRYASPDRSASVESLENVSWGLQLWRTSGQPKADRESSRSARIGLIQVRAARKLQKHQNLNGQHQKQKQFCSHRLRLLS